MVNSYPHLSIKGELQKHQVNAMNKIEYIKFMDLKGKPLLNPERGYKEFNKISYLLVYLSNCAARQENERMHLLEQAGV